MPQQWDGVGDYEAPVPPGEYEDDALMGVWWVEYWNPYDHETGRSEYGLTWAEATAYVDKFFAEPPEGWGLEPQDIGYTIYRTDTE